MAQAALRVPPEVAFAMRSGPFLLPSFSLSFSLSLLQYWGKQIFSLGSFPKVGQKQKTEKKTKRLNDGNNNGQLRIANATSGGERKAAWANLL